MNNEVNVPEGVRRFKAPPDRNGRPVPMWCVKDGRYIQVADLPKIIEQALSQERQRVKEAALRGVAEIVALDDPRADTWPSIETDHARALVAAALDRALVNAPQDPEQPALSEGVGSGADIADNDREILDRAAHRLEDKAVEVEEEHPDPELQQELEEEARLLRKLASAPPPQAVQGEADTEILRKAEEAAVRGPRCSCGHRNPDHPKQGPDCQPEKQCDGSGRIVLGEHPLPYRVRWTDCPGCSRCQPEKGGEG